MSSGLAHTGATTLIALAGGGALYAVGAPTSVAVGFGAGAMAGMMLTPDLDGYTISYSHVRRNFGRALWALWKLVWWPYATLIPHRHVLSHGPFIGTVIRLFYVAAWCVLLWTLAQLGTWATTGQGLTLSGLPLMWLPRTPWPYLAGLWGLVLSDLAHVWMDYHPILRRL